MSIGDFILKVQNRKRRLMQKVNENQNPSDVAIESPRPASATITLYSEQIVALDSLYEGRSVDGNGGVMFGLLGEAFIDERVSGLRYGKVLLA